MNNGLPSGWIKATIGEMVPQDPNDEPAELLLERIRAERAQAEAKKSGGKRKTPRKKSSAEKGRE